MGTELHHVGIHATDLEETVHFWRDLLALDVVEHDENRYDLTDGYHNFRIFQYVDDGRPDHVTGMNSYIHVGVHVDDLGATLARFREAEYPIVSDGLGGDPFDPDDPPERAFKVADPDGIVVDVTADEDQWPGVSMPSPTPGR